MASNTYNMNTWGAKRILGDTSVASIADALLQITANNSWILSSGRQSTYGIKYVYDSSTDHDKIELYGGQQVSNADVPTVWVQLDTGDVYILGQVGINHAPDTYQLYIDGTSYFTNTLTLDNGRINGELIQIIGVSGKSFSFKLTSPANQTAATNVDIGWDWAAGDGAGAAFRGSSFPNQPGYFVIYARKDTTAEYALVGRTDGYLTWRGNIIPNTGNNTGTVGSTTLPVWVDSGQIKTITSYEGNAASATKLETARKINGTSFNGTADITTANWGTARTITIGATGKSVNGSANVSWSMNEIMGSSDNTKFYRGDKTWSNTLNGAFTANGTITANGGYLKSTLNSNTVQIGSQNTSFCHFTNSANIPFWFNRKVYVDGDLSPYGNNEHNCGTSSEKWAHMYCYGRVYLDEWIQFSGATGLYWPNNNGAHLYANNVSSYGALMTQGTRGGYCGIHLGPNTNYMTLMSTEQHQGLYSQTRRWIIYFDRSNDRIGIGDSSTTSGYICQINGACKVTSNLLVNSNNTTGGGIILSDDGDFVDLNDGYGSLRFSYGVRIFSAKSGGSAVITLSNSGGIIANHGHNFMVGGNEVNFIPDGYNSTFWFNYETFNRKNNGTISNYYMGDGHHNWNTTHIYAGAVHNAVWNDFAEFRESDITEPGRTLISNGTGQMILCQERLAPGAKIISDTYGCSVGESDLAKTPLGVAGRVLAYPYQDRNNYKPGDAVCAAPNGTIDIMTREEIMMYPDRIIGIVDEVPVYEQWEQWHTCYKDETKGSEFSRNKVADVQVKGRIWIYVR